GVTEFYKAGEIEVNALLAGNDILLLPEDVHKAIKKIKRAVNNGTLSQELIDSKCKKILRYKYKAGLSDHKPIITNKLTEDLNKAENTALNKKLYENAITIARNQNDILPLKRLDTVKLASVSIGVDQPGVFLETLEKYSSIDKFSLPKDPEFSEIKSLIAELEKYDLVIVSIHNTNNSPRKNYGISQRTFDFISLLKNNTKIILDIFANPYSLGRINDYGNLESIIISYQDNAVSQDVSAQIIMGGIGAKGKLPVTASDNFPAATGIDTKKTRLGYCSPEEVDISSTDLRRIDSIAKNGVEIKAYPGCQILLAKDGKIFYNKSFGHHTYSNITKVNDKDIYDLASLTKIAATTLAIMKLYDEERLDIDQEISFYLPSLVGSNKENLIIREIMAHQAKLKAWIPFYLETIGKEGLYDSIYSNKQSTEFPVRVAKNLYIHKSYCDTIFSRILESPLNRKKDYKYSDLGFYYLMQIIEKVSGQTLDEYLMKNIYLPLNLESMGFLPNKRFDLERIAPSENDTLFRQQILQGDVNDPGAAMLGGIGGHAGLFSNANDMAIIMQMLLQDGEYGGIKFIDKETVDQFTKQQFPLNDNRRGIGFDKPYIEWEENGPTCEGASPNSFGHSGFTGTYAWADPEKQLVYVFLSNRTFPDNSNTKLAKLNIRTNIHQVVYDAINGRYKDSKIQRFKDTRSN
ncbi:MAG: serine hydrolase, partial [Bacteroidales bacterium]|nr:serine hydrolase [Bacteroidales bacterium]